MSDARTVMDAINRHPSLTDADRTNVAEALGLIAYDGFDHSRTGTFLVPVTRPGQLDQETNE